MMPEQELCKIYNMIHKPDQSCICNFNNIQEKHYEINRKATELC